MKKLKNIDKQWRVFHPLAIMLGLVILFVMFMVTSIPARAAELTDEQVINQVFDLSYYIAHNPDVVAAYGSGREALVRHYTESGMREGRSASATFNAKAYRVRYSDLDAAYGDDWIEYVRHYVTVGKSEGRDASPIAQTDNMGSGSDYRLLGSYTTYYKDNVPRAINVGIAAAGINGVVVNPGEEFSYSTTIPARTVENGYQEATIYVNKEKAKGIGGGICQVSSTLYACMKTVGLPATERHPHSLPVDYVPEGWDATISGTAVDLKFVNTYSTPLMITAQANHGTLTVSLYLGE